MSERASEWTIECMYDKYGGGMVLLIALIYIHIKQVPRSRATWIFIWSGITRSFRLHIYRTISITIFILLFFFGPLFCAYSQMHLMWWNTKTKKNKTSSPLLRSHFILEVRWMDTLQNQLWLSFHANHKSVNRKRMSCNCHII